MGTGYHRVMGGAAACPLTYLLLLPGLHAGQQQPFAERVDVARILIDTRVVDGNGAAVLGLSSSDFAVTIDGSPARVESVAWVGNRGTAAAHVATNASGSEARALGSGRVIVFLVQKTLQASPNLNGRELGALIRALQLSDPLLASLTPQDRVAVLSFDSHLKIWSDFSNDFDLVRNLLRKQILQEPPARIAASRGASLVSRLSQEQGRAIYTMEKALRLIGAALEPLPGPKTLILFGYGFGRPDALKRTLVDAANLPGVLNDEYQDALAALVKARTSVLSLDVTEASRHALEVGLQAVAADTGGLFARTNLFPDRAITRMATALAGHYVLSVERPEGRRGSRRVVVKVGDPNVRVHAPSMYFDEPATASAQ